MRHIFATIFTLFCICLSTFAYEYTWQIDETPEGQESATVVQPVVVQLLDQPVIVADGSAAIALMKHYSVVLDETWTHAQASRLLKTFESIPQIKNSLGVTTWLLPTSVWSLSERHIHNDIEITHHGDVRIVALAVDAFMHATPLIAEIDGVRGRYFSKRLHRAVVRFITEDGTDPKAIRYIFDRRYNVSIDIPDYVELTKHTTGEHAGRFSEFKSEELIILISMLEEYPTGMIKTAGLNYLVRRLDGTPHPSYPDAPAVAWTNAGYIEFMETAFTANVEHTQRLVLHEKAHFLWSHLFDDQLKADWIAVGGWYENPDVPDGWSTTKQTEFVSAYAHGINPNEDMAESISYYIVTPDKLRSRSPAKYEFIQNRIMHGTRYISKIREDLTFEVYNLYPDYVYPGRIVKVDIKVEGEPTEDKHITVEIHVHRESDVDSVGSAYARLFSEKGTSVDMSWFKITERTGNKQVLLGNATLSKYAASGYWSPDQINLYDPVGNTRHSGHGDYGWNLYIDNPLADCDPPVYVSNSMRLTLSDAHTPAGRPYQILTAMWDATDETGIVGGSIFLNDENNDTYSLFNHGSYYPLLDKMVIYIDIPDYKQSGTYSVSSIFMQDLANNGISYYFTPDSYDEEPARINIDTPTPDTTPPVLDINNITITAEPTNPNAPNGETIVDITFYIKDDISGYEYSVINLRDPQGIIRGDINYDGREGLYAVGDPTILKKYHHRVVLPVGSAPGIWGLAQMHVYDKAGNRANYDFTEIVRFEVDDSPTETTASGDLNADGAVNILDLVIVANAFGTDDADADVNGDGVVNVLDLVMVANEFNQ